MAHTCHAIDCETTIPPEMLMCWRHWRLVPKALQRQVLETYRPGQCDDWQPSAAYCDAAQAAVLAVAIAEGKDPAPNHPKLTLYETFKPRPPVEET